jgi:hypothetical protein
MEDFLALAGESYFRRKVIASLEMTEKYTVTATTVHMERNTSIGQSTDQLYRLDATGGEDLVDPVLGSVRSLTRISDDGSRLTNALTRASDRASFVGVRRVPHDDYNHLIYSINLTLSNRQSAYCVRHYARMVSPSR